MNEPVPTDEVTELAAALASQLHKLESYPKGRFVGDGIVICAGGASIFTNAYVLVHVLRTLFRCTLPIEVWHLGTGEMSARMRHLLRELSAEPVDAEAIMAARGVQLNDGWQLKSFALSESSFARVLLLDADIGPERDPATLFEWPEFETAGAVLWPDICSIVADNQIWAACGLAPRTTRAAESGQVLVDKCRHWHALQIIVFLNLQSKQYYRMVYGDKDLFLMGFLIADKPYYLVPHLPYTDQPWCLFQRDFAGERVFQHRTGAKWRFDGPQTIVPGFRFEEACDHALAALRRGWNGRIFNAPNRSLVAQAEEDRLTGVAYVSLVVPGEAPQSFRLLAGGEIVDSCKLGLLHWFCIDDDRLELVLRDRFERNTHFIHDHGDCWVQAGSKGPAGPVIIERSTPIFDNNLRTPERIHNLDHSRYRFDDV